MDPNTIRQLLRFSEKCKGYYDRLDNAMGGKGRAKYIVYLVALLVILVCVLSVWKIVVLIVGLFLGGSATAEPSMASGNSELSFNNIEVTDQKIQDEFEF